MRSRRHSTLGLIESATIVCALAIGVAAAVAVGVVSYAANRLSLPAENAALLYRVWDESLRGEVATTKSLNSEQFLRIREAFPRGSVTVYSATRVVLDSPANSDPVMVKGLFGSHDLMAVLGALPSSGRDLNSADEDPQTPFSVLVSERLVVGTERLAVGTTISLDGVEHVVVGVMPAKLMFPDERTFFWAAAKNDSTPGKELRFEHALLRQPMGWQASDVQARLLLGLEGTSAAPRIRRLEDEVASSLRPLVLLFQCCAVALLGVALANARWMYHRRVLRLQQALAIRAVLGATPSLLRHRFLVGALAIGAVAAIPTLLITAWLVSALRESLRVATLLLPAIHFGVPWALLAATAPILMAVVAALPAARVGARADLMAALHTRVQRPRAGPAILQTGLSFAPASLAVAGVLSVGTLLFDGIGFMPDGLSAVRLHYAGKGLPDPVVAAAERDELAHSLRAVGVQAAMINTPPVSDRKQFNSLRMPDSPGDFVLVGTRIATADYLPLVGAHAVAGTLSMKPGHREAVVNDVLARQLFDGEEGALGGSFIMGAEWDPPFTIVGVTRAIRHEGALSVTTPAIYALNTELTHLQSASAPNWYVVFRRSTVSISDLKGLVDRRMPEWTVAEVLHLDELMYSSAGIYPVLSKFISVMLVLVLTLTVVGHYALVARTLAARRYELAIRTALGADPARLVTQCLRSTAVVGVAGLIIGILLDALATRLAANLGLVPGQLTLPSPTLRWLVAASLVLATMAIGAYWPVRAAFREDHAAVLRESA